MVTLGIGIIGASWWWSNMVLHEWHSEIKDETSESICGHQTLLRNLALHFTMLMFPSWANLRTEWRRQCGITNFCFRRITPSWKIVPFLNIVGFLMNIVFIKPPSIIIYCISNLSENLIVLGCLSNFMKSFRYGVWNNITKCSASFTVGVSKNGFLDKISAILFNPRSYSNSKSNFWSLKGHQWIRVGCPEQDGGYNLRSGLWSITTVNRNPYT